MSTDNIYQAVTRVAKTRIASTDNKLDYLDIGAGPGNLIRILGSEIPVKAHACDYHIELFNNKDVPIDQIDLNNQDLPYEDAAFDLITCSEVIEHVENFRKVIREINRVLKPGGLCILTTPNVLNVKSRMRFFGSGFFNLFGPLPIKNDKLYSTGGHITPIPYFYIAHALADADFSDIQVTIDKKQKTSVIWLILLAPLFVLGRLLFNRGEYKKFKTITDTNEEHVRKHFTMDVLTGRTVVVSAIKE